METNLAHIRALIFEKMAGSISEADNRLLETAIEQHEEVAQLWKDVQEQMSSAQARAFMTGMNEDRAWQAVEARLKAPAKHTRAVLRWSAAAAVLLLLSAGLTYWMKTAEKPALSAVQPSVAAPRLQLSSGRQVALTAGKTDTLAAGNVQFMTTGNQLRYTAEEAGKNEWATLEIPPRLDYKIVLKDGTEVWLNASSSLRFPYAFDGNAREVYLSGEAYFKVAPNPQQPFIVHAGPTSVRVLGTAFNLHAYNPAEITTSLVEGAVITSAGEQQVQLRPGHQSVYRGGQFSTAAFDPALSLSWMSGTSNFHDMPLQGVAAIVSRWYDVKVVFDTPGLEQQKISGAINKQKPLDVFLTNLSLSSGITSRLENGVLHLQ